MNEWLPVIEQALKKYLYVPEMPYRSVAEAMAYSAEAGGKRLRPMLVLEFCRLVGGDPAKALPFACAVEMIHTYSLIHDDLPCMDDDDLRRGRPSCHKQFGEATALLAGDGLLTKAFGVLAEAELPAETVAAAVRTLSAFAGPEGMVAGQMIDLINEKTPPAASVLELTYRLKTSALLQASCRLGVLAGGGTEVQVQQAGEYAYHLGMAFQIIDDILDVTGDTAVLGKPVGSDASNGKVTFVTLQGLDGARRLAAQYSRNALQALSAFAGSEELSAMTEQLLSRRN
ncbi:MAG: polyprenyl synthetase family protein [Candidatus Merdivicinus sp.]|jgi:geranylgeranyl diphosphate synthase type II